MPPLTLPQLTQLALEHWTTFQPSTVETWRGQGTLIQRAERAARETLREMNSLIASGSTSQEAWMTVRERYLLRPPETTPPVTNDLTDLMTDLMNLHRLAASDLDAMPPPTTSSLPPTR